MKSYFNKIPFFLITITVIGVLLRIYTLYFLRIDNINLAPPFFLELINKTQVLPPAVIYISSLANLLIIFWLGQKLFGSRVGILAAFLYSSSPWIIYADISGSIYIFLLLWLLSFFVGIVSVQASKWYIGMFLILISTAFLLYDSLLMLFVLPALFLSIYPYLNKNLFRSKFFIMSLVIILLPLFLAMLKNLTGVKNILNNEVSLFSNVGLLNAVNQFRGETDQTNLAVVAKLAENRYLYFTKHAILNFLKNFAPVVYFTSEFKLLNFSFSPPILFGFIIPFFWGLRKSLNLLKRTKFLLLIIPALLIPSTVSKSAPDLLRLIIVSPVIFYAIALGFEHYDQTPKTPALRVLFTSAVLLVILQSLVTVVDISLREPVRFMQILGK